MNYEEIFGIKIASGSREELLKACADMLGAGGAISTVNPEILSDSVKDAELHESLLDSLNIPDGIGVERELKLRGLHCERLPGVELGEELLDIKPLTLSIIGGKVGVAKSALRRLAIAHPLVREGFSMDGYSYTTEKFIHLLGKHSPDLVFVCLGSPKQEIFIKTIKKYAPKTLFIALGGSADIYSGTKARAPLAFRYTGTEWIYRTLREPKRIKRLPKLFRFTKEARKERIFLHQNAQKSIKKL